MTQSYPIVTAYVNRILIEKTSKHTNTQNYFVSLTLFPKFSRKKKEKRKINLNFFKKL